MALLLCSGEQAGMDDWRWANAWRLSLLPEVPMHLLLQIPGSSLQDPVSHLADPNWITASWAYTREIGLLKEPARTKASGVVDENGGKRRTKSKGKGETEE